MDKTENKITHLLKVEELLIQAEKNLIEVNRVSFEYKWPTIYLKPFLEIIEGRIESLEKYKKEIIENQ